MGLTKNSTGLNVTTEDIFQKNILCDYTIALAGNPNVGKSTIFNSLTGLHQHTGNWPGKTVSNAAGTCKYKEKNFLFVDLPGTYSLMSNSQEEEIARDYICFAKPDITIVVIDATSLERNLNLVYQTMELTPNVIVCVNLLDEAKKKGISIDFKNLSTTLGVPVVGTIARKKKSLEKLLSIVNEMAIGKIKTIPKLVKYPDNIENHIAELLPEINTLIKNNYISRWIALKLLENDSKILSSIETNLSINLSSTKIKNIISNFTINTSFKDILVSTIVEKAEEVNKKVCTFENNNYNMRDRKIDKILTSKKWGIPIMLLFLGVIFWITITGANYPSSLLSNVFAILKEKLIFVFDYLGSPIWLKGILIDGVYTTLSWVIAVMLPPMAIFFPLFTFLEDLGYLPRIAFNLDKCFKKCCTSGKQALTMCMGFGCNAAGVVGCRIIDSPRERLIAILTNNFVPCNGRFPFLITLATIFIGSFFASSVSSVVATISVVLLILLGIYLTLIISKILSKTLLKGMPSSFILELPPYRKPQVGKILVRSLLDRTLFVLGRAIAIAAPTGLIIWLFANVTIGNVSILTHVANFLEPFARLIGFDGYILLAFILGFPANEIVLPIILMSYMASGTLINLEDTFSIGKILIQNGWTLLTGINAMIFSLLHFPCSTTLLTIKKETNSWKWTLLAFALPTICGIIICMITTGVYNIFVM